MLSSCGRYCKDFITGLEENPFHGAAGVALAVTAFCLWGAISTVAAVSLALVAALFLLVWVAGGIGYAKMSPLSD